jgi:soluble lytic murein transglycosylase
VLALVIRLSACSLLLLLSGVAGSAALSGESDVCDQPEPCFQAAALPKERLGKALTKEQVLALKLDRLQRLIERFPDSVWAKRAGLLSGVLSVERNPASAIPFLRGAQRDFTVLDDYIRLWIAQAQLNLGEAKDAAVLLESIPMAVPDSNILTKAAYKTGEAWYQASSCQEATAWFTKAVAMNDKDAGAPQSYLRRAACRLRENNVADGRDLLRQLWMRFPYSPEAKEAEALLSSNLGGETWTVQPAERLNRAQAFLAQAFHAEAIDELKKFLLADPHSPRRADAKLKLGVAQVRLKQYDQARETFRGLTKEGGPESHEATVWLARVHLRLGQGDKLMETGRLLPSMSLGAEQKGQITLFVGMWLEDQKQYDEAIAKYQHVARQGEPASQRAEGLWRVGWVHYRMGRYREAGDNWRALAEQHDIEFEPQALYWMARAGEQERQPEAQDYYRKLCQRHRFTYYCQLARERMKTSPGLEAPLDVSVVSSETSIQGEPGAAVVTRADISQQTAYRRAIELRTLGLDADAAHEVAVLTERYSRVPEALVALSTMLNEVGAYHQALRLARARFRDQLERTGGAVAPSLWNVAYPTGLLPTIKLQGAKGVDPYLIAAIIREESQYDVKAVSRVGAIGLMQVMPATANTVAQRVGLPAVGREDLFDQETNIRIGVRYVEQLLEQFSGNVVYTIASYNAGPLAVGNWIAQYQGQDQDEFVELIPYQETRQYVKRVLRSYREYVRLGGLS